MSTKNPAVGVKIKLANINMSNSTQVRFRLDDAKASDFSDLIKDGVKFPDVDLFAENEDAKLWVADGYHRIAAYQILGEESIKATIHYGGELDAWLFGLEKNGKQGDGLSKAEKRRAVERMLSEPKWSKWGDREISRRCGVGNKFVGDVRRELQEQRGAVASVSGTQMPDTPKIRTAIKNGKEITIDTTKIGTTKKRTMPIPHAAPSPPVELERPRPAPAPVVDEIPAATVPPAETIPAAQPPAQPPVQAEAPAAVIAPAPERLPELPAIEEPPPAPVELAAVQPPPPELTDDDIGCQATLLWNELKTVTTAMHSISTRFGQALKPPAKPRPGEKEKVRPNILDLKAEYTTVKQKLFAIVAKLHQQTESS